MDTPPTTLSEMIALSADTLAIFQSAIRSPAGGNLLLHGPSGTGKSLFCRVIAIEAMRSSGLAVLDYKSALRHPNILTLDHKSGYDKAALISVEKTASLVTLNETGRRWLIVDEFDGISPKLDNFVKPWLDGLDELEVQVFASTNHLAKIDVNVRSRFNEIYLGPHAAPEMRYWAEAELQRLSVTRVSPADLSQLVNKAAGSVRELKKACRHYAEHGRVI